MRIYLSLNLNMESLSLKLILFIIVTCGLLYVSRKSLRDTTSHGFYRFFAWESILVLLLINMSVWFYDPFSLQQIVSWLFLIGSLILLSQGIHQLRSLGNSSNNRQDGTLYAFERTTTLVTSGIYHYIRHPLYASLLYLAWGTLLKDITWSSVCLVIIVTISLVATAKKDETECIRFFGQIYRDYMVGTKMFIPFLF
jgi:protein-S-isoprenylcysteine O-methyltransferase Ste14